MIVIPAIDLRQNKVVRLVQGNYAMQTEYSDKPDEVAMRFEEQGASRLHVVDLDGALDGKPRNFAAIENILKHVSIPVEVGGGIREHKTIKTYLGLGIQWTILGTKACLDPGFLNEMVREYGDRVIVGVDAKNGYIATDGWTKTTQTKALDFILGAEAMGVQTVIYTDILKDGTMQGPNMEALKLAACKTHLWLIASGGFSTLEDLKALCRLKLERVAGVVIGKALYENKFSLPEAMKVCSPSA